MKKILSTFILSLCFLQFFAQEKKSLKHHLQGKTNFIEIKNIAHTYFENDNTKWKTQNDNEYIAYMRWEWFWESRVNPDGSFPDLNAQYEIYKKLQNKKTRSNDWKNISQKTSVSGYNGMGRLVNIAFHPTDTNIFYVAAPIGGIWRTADGGNTWTPLGDQLPHTSVGNIIVHPDTPSILYITVGKNEGWWEYGLGIYKSTDEGQTWTPTAQTSNFTQAIVYYKILMDTLNPQVIYSAQSDGLWKTQNGGNSWYKIRNGTYNDIEFKPYNTNTLYVSKYDYWGSSEVYRSTDTGATWTKISNFAQTQNSIEMTITLADSNYLGVGINGNSSNKFYLSTDGGDTFILKNSNIDDNISIVISPTVKDRVYCGYVSNWRSNNAGASWVQITNWYNDGVLAEVHADNHHTAVNPLNKKYIYFCNDGGLYRYNEQTQQWKDLSNGLIITEFYKIAVSQQDSVFMIGGTQDNGGRKRMTMNAWGATNGGDGMEVAINPTNDQTMYTTYWGGVLYRSYDQWVTDKYYEITPDTTKGAWVTPYMLDPNNPNRLVAGYRDVWISDNEGDTWTPISNNLTGAASNKLEVLDVARKNSNVIYTGRGKMKYHTTNLGTTWQADTIPGSTDLFEKVSCFMVHPFHENILYATKAGYGNNSKVYVSNDYGKNWTNITYNIPNIPVNCIIADVYSDSANIDIYIGTDVGVFYKKDNDATWQYFGNGLPNTRVSDLEIFYPTGKLRAGTYGRGIWEAQIARPVAPLQLNQEQKTLFDIALIENPVTNEFVLQFNDCENTQFNVNLYDTKGSNVMKNEIQIKTSNQHVPFNISTLSSGMYYIEVTNGSSSKKFKLLKK